MNFFEPDIILIITSRMQIREYKQSVKWNKQQ